MLSDQIQEHDQAHTAQAPTRQANPNPLDWIETSDADFDRLVSPRLSKPEYLPSTDPAALRAQFWADAIYDRLRDQFPGQLAAVPRPRIRLWLKGGPNGFASPLSTCLRVPVRFEAAADNAPETSDATVAMTAKGLVFPVPTKSCVDHTATTADAALIAEQLSRNLGGCCVTATDNELVFGKDCTISPKITAKRATGFMLTATSNVVVLTSGLLEFAEVEDEFVGVLAHELGHYIHSHPALWTQNYNFFYRQTNANLTSRPVADPSLRDLGDRLVKVTRRSKAYPVSGQTLHSSLYPVLVGPAADLARKACVGTECSTWCESYVTMASSEEFKKAMGSFPSAPVSDGAAVKYHSLESNVLACLESLQVSQTQLTGAGLVSVQDALAVFPEAKPQDINERTRLVELLTDKSNSLFAQDETVNAVLQQALGEKLGYYTYEQEADDLATEWLAMLGIQPTALVQKLFGVSRMYKPLEYNTQYDFGYEKCKELYDAGWTDAVGEVQVPIGDFANPHHGRCYRIFNIDREIRAHKYAVDPSARPQGPGGTWQSIRQWVQEQHRARGIADSELPEDVQSLGFVQ